MVLYTGIRTSALARGLSETLRFRVWRRVTPLWAATVKQTRSRCHGGESAETSGLRRVVNVCAGDILSCNFSYFYYFYYPLQGPVSSPSSCPKSSAKRKGSYLLGRNIRTKKTTSRHVTPRKEDIFVIASEQILTGLSLLIPTILPVVKMCCKGDQ